MLLKDYIRKHKEEVENNLAKRGYQNIQYVNDVVEGDRLLREKKNKEELLKAEINKISKKISIFNKEEREAKIEEVKRETAFIKEEIRVLGGEIKEIEQNIDALLKDLPNLTHESVPQGSGEKENVVLFESKFEKKQENKKTHWELAETLDLIDFERGTVICGSGFPLYKGQGAKLQRALIQYFLDAAIQRGYTEYIPPFLVNEQSAFGTGQLPDKEGQMYEIGLDGFYLIPTSEVPLTNIYRNKIIKKEELPIKMCAYSPCFRREAGSYGKEVRGLNRLHQFDKVEIVQITEPEKSYQTLEEMVAHVEFLLAELELPYRKLLLCSGDTGFASAKTIDLEVWSSAQEKWLEVSSVSVFETFQSNRLKIRFRDNKKNTLVHTLNGSALALPRIMAALLENNQEETKIVLPTCLHPYTQFENIEIL